MPELDIQQFLSDLSDRQIRFYAAAVEDMVKAEANGNTAAMRDATARLADVIAETMGVAEIVGATSVLRETAGLMSSEKFKSDEYVHWYGWNDRQALTFATTPTQTILPRVTFEEAVTDLIDRTPTVIRSAAERTAQNIAKLYGEGAGGIPRIAFVRSAEVSVTKHVQGMIATAVSEGITEVEAGKAIAKAAGDWSESYARMAFRTNVNTAATAGRFRQARDPDIMAVLPAMQFLTSGVEPIRKNHKAGEGKIMLTVNSHWNHVSSPLGYNCKCTVRMVGLPELRRMNRVRNEPTHGFTRVMDGVYVREDTPPAGWHADEDFRHGGRPDLMMTELA